MAVVNTSNNNANTNPADTLITASLSQIMLYVVGGLLVWGYFKKRG